MSVGLIFDFDGVLADSEIIANEVLAQMITAAGCPISLTDSLERYCGRRWADVSTRIAADLGQPLPEDFQQQLLQNTLAAFTARLNATSGAGSFIARFSHLPQCIASSSARPRLDHCLDLLGWTSVFDGRVISADEVRNGKPAPDVFLLAAQRLGTAPERCIVFEDSVAGVMAGRAAGMNVIGYCGGAHIRAGHAEALRAAGAHCIVSTWMEAAQITLNWRQDHVDGL